MFLAFFCFLLNSIEYKDITEPLSIRVSGDYYVIECYFHDILLQYGFSVISIDNIATYTYTFIFTQSTVSDCSSRIDTVFSLSENFRIEFTKNCFYRIQSQVEAAIIRFSSIYNQQSGDPHQIHYSSFSLTKGGYFIMKFQDQSESSILEFTYNNISHTTLTTTTVSYSAIGLIQYWITNSEIHQNTFSNNNLSVCGCLYFSSPDDIYLLYIRECNFVNNIDTGHMMLYFENSNAYVINCYFLDNTVKDDTLIYINGGVLHLNDNIYSNGILFFNNGGNFADINNNIGRSTTIIKYFATKFCSVKYSKFPHTQNSRLAFLAKRRFLKNLRF